jgi:hypothetical protein
MDCCAYGEWSGNAKISAKISAKKIITPKLAFRGDYLYDKGENDELIHVIGSQPIYKYILTSF